MIDRQQASSEADDLYASLRARQDEIKAGGGIRYKVQTQRGFLNVHSEPEDPFATHNIVSQLQEGQIVTSVGPPSGTWVQHDAGGWSVREFGGFQWLVPID